MQAVRRPLVKSIRTSFVCKLAGGSCEAMPRMSMSLRSTPTSIWPGDIQLIRTPVPEKVALAFDIRPQASSEFHLSAPQRPLSLPPMPHENSSYNRGPSILGVDC